MAFCINCGTRILEDYEFCPECGRAVSLCSDVHVEHLNANEGCLCKKCNEEVPQGMFYCLNCGALVNDEPSDFESVRKRAVMASRTCSSVVDTSVGVWKNKWVSLVLCALFGVFGMHRFYEGKRITAFIYMFTFGLLGLGWFFDMVLLLTKPNPYRVK